ncbi:DUF5615 family PIN-like protein [Thioalkalicoccus limnaeus]|uniref:DUF5615 family PIN-like protein n=1 Tax=Thioalkalicoccus limnaeus TaxID=120681 RepID=UPI0034E94C6D
MKLLLDENLSPKLPGLLAELCPGSSQIDEAGLRGARDAEVWEYAKANRYILVSKDNDFGQRSFQYGAPPKVVWLNVGNAGNVSRTTRHSPCSASTVAAGARPTSWRTCGARPSDHSGRYQRAMGGLLEAREGVEEGLVRGLPG